MTTVFLTALEVQKHLKMPSKFQKNIIFHKKTKIQIYTQTKFLIACEEKNKLFKHARAMSQSPPPPNPFLSLSFCLISHTLFLRKALQDVLH